MKNSVGLLVIISIAIAIVALCVLTSALALPVNSSESITPSNATVNKANNPISLFLDGAQANLTTTAPATVNATATALGGMIYLYMNGTLLTNGSSPQIDITTLPIGTYVYFANATGDVNYKDNATGITLYVFINKTVAGVGGVGAIGAPKVPIKIIVGNKTEMHFIFLYYDINDQPKEFTDFIVGNKTIDTCTTNSSSILCHPAGTQAILTYKYYNLNHFISGDNANITIAYKDKSMGEVDAKYWVVNLVWAIEFQKVIITNPTILWKAIFLVKGNSLMGVRWYIIAGLFLLLVGILLRYRHKWQLEEAKARRHTY